MPAAASGALWRLVATAAGAGLAVALPAALVAQVADAVVDGDVPTPLTFVLVTLVFGGAGLSGWVVGHRGARDGVGTGGLVLLGAASGLVTITVVEAVGVARRLAAGEDVAWASVPVVLVVAAALAGVVAERATVAAAHRAGRTRS